MHSRWREAKVEDLPECLSFNPAEVGAGIVGREQAANSWARLHKNKLLQGAIVETQTSEGKKEILGFGASVFVSRTFAEREISDPRPGLNDRLIASIGTADSAVLTEAEIAAGNAGSGLWNVILTVSWRRPIDEDRFQRFAVHSGEGYERLHEGYQIAGIIT